MKNILRISAMVLVGVVAMGLTACNNGGGNNGGMTVSPSALTFDVDGNVIGDNTVTVAGSDWTASTNESWIRVAPASGVDGESFTVTVTGTAPSARQGEVSVRSTTNSALEKLVIVKQQAPSIIRDPEAETLVGGLGSYYADYYEIGLSNFDLEMYTFDTELELDGKVVYVDFFAADITDPRNPQIASGTYTVSESLEVNTILPGYYDEEAGGYVSSVVAIVEGGSYTEILGIMSGTVQIENDGNDGYVIAYDLQLSDGSTYKAYYSGTLNVSNATVMSNLPGDVEVAPMNLGMGAFYGDWYVNDTYNYVISLATASLGDTDFGEAIDIELITPQNGDGTVIPAGNYYINDTTESGTALSGSMFWGMFPQGVWYYYYGETEDYSAPLISGQVNIGSNAGVYTIGVDGLDDIGNSVTGSFTGTIDISIDQSPAMAPANNNGKTLRYGLADKVIANGKIHGVRK